MDKGTFRALTAYLNPKTRNYQGGRVQVRPHKMVAMTLCYLGSKLPYKQLSGIFGVCEECYIRTTNHVLELLVGKSKEIIKWPSKEKYREITDEFNQNRRRSFPNVIGAIDGCHIQISAGASEKNAYYNFKRYHSIHLQAVCTADRKFTDIFVGYVINTNAFVFINMYIIYWIKRKQDST